MIHDCVGRTLFCFAGETGFTYSWEDLQRVILFTERWLNKQEIVPYGQVAAYDPLLNEPFDGRAPDMYTFDQFVTNLGTDDEEYSVQCEYNHKNYFT